MNIRYNKGAEKLERNKAIQTKMQLEIAKAMKDKESDIDFISGDTGLSKVQIEAL